LQIGNVEDAKSMVRKYIVGTRSRHKKVASVVMEEEPKGPNKEGLWTIIGNYVTEEGQKEQFKATVTSRGEVSVATINPVDTGGKQRRFNK